ncbi:hypothetical protein AVEN_87969-1 [Araneus ventricosus]|uniref:Uncharacterized protein n=1 Tax=Araneus ventricosus TaxID=182803 RepID=A0A4Y2I521_ARAVE|nr:hypothetical protein AVEN_87969-1 [Araneus ventricosus]
MALPHTNRRNFRLAGFQLRPAMLTSGPLASGLIRDLLAQSPVLSLRFGHWENMMPPSLGFCARCLESEGQSLLFSEPELVHVCLRKSIRLPMFQPGMFYTLKVEV